VGVPGEAVQTPEEFLNVLSEFAGRYRQVTSIPKTSRLGRFFGFCSGLRMLHEYVASGFRPGPKGYALASRDSAIKPDVM
jgi:hypothetical protein